MIFVEQSDTETEPIVLQCLNDWNKIQRSYNISVLIACVSWCKEKQSWQRSSLTWCNVTAFQRGALCCILIEMSKLIWLWCNQMPLNDQLFNAAVTTLVQTERLHLLTCCPADQQQSVFSSLELDGRLMTSRATWITHTASLTNHVRAAHQPITWSLTRSLRQTMNHCGA